jgi:hypothetical protein
LALGRVSAWTFDSSTVELLIFSVFLFAMLGYVAFGPEKNRVALVLFVILAVVVLGGLIDYMAERNRNTADCEARGGVWNVEPNAPHGGWCISPTPGP